MTDNPWRLFSSVPGWRHASRHCDEAMRAACAGMDARVAAGGDLAGSARQAWADWHGASASVIDFGSHDTEPQEFAARLINAHLIARHGYDGPYLGRFALSNLEGE